MKKAIARTCSSAIQVAVAYNGRMRQIDTQLMSKFEIWFPKDDRQRVLWPSVAVLSADYFELLLAHAVPLNEFHYAGAV